MQLFEKKGLEKMNPRCFNFESQLAEGNEDVFWGLLFDIRMYFGNNYNAADKTKSLESQLKIPSAYNGHSFELQVFEF